MDVYKLSWKKLILNNNGMPATIMTSEVQDIVHLETRPGQSLCLQTRYRSNIAVGIVMAPKFMDSSNK